MKLAWMIPALLAAGGLALAEDLHIVTNADDAPFSMMRDGALSGIATDAIRAALTQLHLSGSFAAYPWSRAVAVNENGPNSCIYPAARTPDREALFKWVGSLGEDSWAVFARPDSAIRPNSIADLSHYRLGANRNEALAAFLEQNNVKVEWVTDLNPHRINFQKLYSGRIDLIDQLNHVIREMQDDGRYDSLVRRYQ